MSNLTPAELAWDDQRVAYSDHHLPEREVIVGMIGLIKEIEGVSPTDLLDKLDRGVITPAEKLPNGHYRESLNVRVDKLWAQLWALEDMEDVS